MCIRDRQSAGLNVGEITYEESATVAAGVVIRQSVSGTVDEGTYVGFTVSLGAGQSGTGTGEEESDGGTGQ